MGNDRSFSALQPAPANAPWSPSPALRPGLSTRTDHSGLIRLAAIAIFTVGLASIVAFDEPFGRGMLASVAPSSESGAASAAAAPAPAPAAAEAAQSPLPFYGSAEAEASPKVESAGLVPYQAPQAAATQAARPTEFQRPLLRRAAGPDATASPLAGAARQMRRLPAMVAPAIRALPKSRCRSMWLNFMIPTVLANAGNAGAALMAGIIPCRVLQARAQASRLGTLGEIRSLGTWGSKYAYKITNTGQAKIDARVLSSTREWWHVILAPGNSTVIRSQLPLGGANEVSVELR
jgi:hypothetical protein